VIEEIPNRHKRILFEFIGGFRDGKTADSHDANPEEASWAEAYFLLTDQGTVGKSFKLPSDAALSSMMEEGLRRSTREA
jgi:hypothetical protein